MALSNFCKSCFYHERGNIATWIVKLIVGLDMSNLTKDFGCLELVLVKWWVPDLDCIPSLVEKDTSNLATVIDGNVDEVEV